MQIKCPIDTECLLLLDISRHSILFSKLQAQDPLESCRIDPSWINPRNDKIIFGDNEKDD